MALHQIAALAVLVALGVAVDAVVKLVRRRRRPDIDKTHQQRRLAFALAAFLALALLFLAVSPDSLRAP